MVQRVEIITGKEPRRRWSEDDRRRLRVRLGGIASNNAAYPGKPHRMRWRTYNAIVERIACLEGDADAMSFDRFARRWG